MTKFKGSIAHQTSWVSPFFVGPQPMSSITSTWLKWRLKFFNAIFNFHTHCSNVMASLYAIRIFLPQHDLNNSVNEVMHRNFWHQQIWTWTMNNEQCSVHSHTLMILSTLIVFSVHDQVQREYRPSNVMGFVTTSPSLSRAPTNEQYSINLTQVTSPFRSPEVGPSFNLFHIVPPASQVPVTTPINCGAKEVVAQVVSNMALG